MNQRSKHRIMLTITIAMIVVVLLCALYIMANQLGLQDSLDFGAGAYYYADIPNYQKYVREDVYHTDIPYWVYVSLFLAWGWLMYRLLVWIEGRGNKKDRDGQ